MRDEINVRVEKPVSIKANLPAYLSLLIIISFLYCGIFLYSNSIYYDRDDACIQFANKIMSGENPYGELTQAGNPITTGIFGIIAIPFVYLFGDIRIMTFIFWLLIVIRLYSKTWFPYFAIFFILSWLPLKTMVYRMDEFYFPLIFLFYGHTTLFIIIFLLSRNWFVIPNHGVYNMFFKGGLYLLLIPLALIGNGIIDRIKKRIEYRERFLYQLHYLSK